MQILKKILFVLLFSLAIISCEDEIINNYTGGNISGKFGAAIGETSYELIFRDKSLFDASIQPGYYYDGIKLMVKLQDPSKKDSVNRMTMGSYYDLDNQDLKNSYVDSIGGYIFNFREFYMPSYGGGHTPGPFSAGWIMTLYDAFNNPSIDDTTTVWSHFLRPTPQHEWIGEKELEIVTTSSYGASAKAETHLLNASGEEIKVYQSDIYNKKWLLSDVPDEAVYFQFICTDIYGGVKRTAFSGKYGIKARFSDNVELINDVEFPFQMEYLENIDKILSYSRDLNELALFNYEDNAVVWKKKLASGIYSFAYSPERNGIYLANHQKGVVEYINPADGSAQELFKSNYYIGRILVAGNFIVLIPMSSVNYINYNFETQTISEPYPLELTYRDYFTENLYGAEYDARTKIAYIKDYFHLIAFDFAETTGILKYREHKDTYPYVYSNKNFKLDEKRAYNGSGRIFEIPNTVSGSMIEIGNIGDFSDIAIIPNSYIITIGASYKTETASYPPPLSVYNYDLTLLGQKNNLIGTPIKIINKGNTLKAYYVLLNNRLAAEKYTLEEIINPAGN